MRRSVLGCVGLMLVLGSCDAADDVEVQPLPELDRPSPEARAGLPEIAGAWRFAGWELAPDDSAALESELPGFGDIVVETQRLDSIAGSYVVGETRAPLVGEVRRDSVVSLIGGGRFLSGRVLRDTMWIHLTSLVEGGAWPDDARAAFVRSPAPARFARLRGARPALAAADTLALDTARMAAADTLAAPAPAGAPGAGEPGRAAGQPAPGRPQERAAPTPTEPRQAEPEPPPQRAEPEPDPEPEPEVTEEPEARPEPPPQRRRPQLLGRPVERDSLPELPGAA